LKKALYKKIYDDIYLKIHDGTYSTGDLLPSESEMEEGFQVSRTPVRQALKELENDGYIYRLQGKGSFVANISANERWTMTTGFGSQYSKEWNRISAKTLTIKYIKHKEYAKSLGLLENAKIIYLERLRYFNGQPLVYMEHYMKPVVPIGIFEKDKHFVSAAGKLIKDHLNIEFTHIEEEVEAISADPILSRHLEVETGFPLLKIKRLSFLEESLIDINIYFVRTDIWTYKVNFNG
jgi:GntR family transcriptional regulator